MPFELEMHSQKPLWSMLSTLEPAFMLLMLLQEELWQVVEGYMDHSQDPWQGDNLWLLCQLQDQQVHTLDRPGHRHWLWLGHAHVKPVCANCWDLFSEVLSGSHGWLEEAHHVCRRSWSWWVSLPWLKMCLYMVTEDLGTVKNNKDIICTS